MADVKQTLTDKILSLVRYESQPRLDVTLGKDDTFHMGVTYLREIRDNLEQYFKEQKVKGVLSFEKSDWACVESNYKKRVFAYRLIGNNINDVRGVVGVEIDLTKSNGRDETYVLKFSSLLNQNLSSNLQPNEIRDSFVKYVDNSGIKTTTAVPAPSKN